MKLNLLPTHVSKEGQSKIAWIVMAVMSIASVGAGIFFVAQSNNELNAAKERDQNFKPYYDKVVATANRADEIMANSVGINRNIRLADAMDKHNDVYPSLYKEVLNYCPSYFRVLSISAVPLDDKACTVTMQGVIQTYQQYADIMLAMLRIKDAVNVTRAGFTDTRSVVPALNEGDQLGSPVKPGETNLPSDPQARLEELVNRASQAPTGYQGINGFGDNSEQKGAMPNWSQITITVTLARNIQTPNPRATLTSQGGATPSGGGASPQQGNGGSGFTPSAGGGKGGPLSRKEQDQ